MKKFKQRQQQPENNLDTLFPKFDAPRGIVRNLVQDFHEVNCYEYPIKGEIGDAIDYEELVNMLRSAGEEDVVRITINTEGGNLHTVQEIVAEIKRSPAFVVCSVYGEASSGGTMIALACDSMDEYDIEDNSSWLFHNASWGTGGKAQDVEDSVDHSRILFRRVMKQHYEHFLTEAEIEEVIRGKQLYMFGDEVKQRLKKRDELRAKANEPVPEVNEKKPRTKKIPAEAQ